MALLTGGRGIPDTHHLIGFWKERISLRVAKQSPEAIAVYHAYLAVGTENKKVCATAAA